MNGKERIVAALNRQPVDHPVWFMRQAEDTSSNIENSPLSTRSGNAVRT